MLACRVVLLIVMCAGCARVRLPEARMSRTAGQALTWERAVELALAHHPALRKARAERDAARHHRNQALGAYLPSLDGTMSRKRARTTTSTTADALAFDLDAVQPLFTGFKTSGEAMQAWREWEAAHWAYVEESAAVRQALRGAFVERLRLDQLLGVNRAIAARRQDNAELIRLRYEAGREHEGSWRRAQAIADEAAFDVRQTERRIESQSLALGRQIGGAFTLRMEVAGSFDTLLPASPDAPADYVELAERTPPVQRLTRRAEALKAAVVASQAELWPTIEGTFNYGYSGARVSRLKDDASLGVTVSVPLFHGGQRAEGVRESRAEYQAALEEARSERDAQIAVLGERWAAFRDAWELVGVRQAFLDAARKRSEIVRAQYTSGLAEFQEFDIAEQELADAETAHVQSLADVLIKEAQWSEAQGGTLEDVRPVE
jgi:outer membrane protein TolC